WLYAMKFKGIARDPGPIKLFASSPSRKQDINRDIAHQIFEDVVLRLEVHQFRSSEGSSAPIITRTRHIVNEKQRVSVGASVRVWLEEYGIDGAEHYCGRADADSKRQHGGCCEAFRFPEPA